MRKDARMRAPSSLDFDFPLSGKTALVTGAASGIGAAIAEALAAKSVRVAVVDLNEEAARAKAQTLSGAMAMACNVADPASVARAVAAVAADFGRIDILVNSAGIVDLAPAEDISLMAWQRTIDINLTGSFLMAQEVGRRMIAQGGGRIINLASQAGSVAIDQHVAYCASKFGVVGLTKTLALEWGQHGITVNSISPTVVLTDLGKAAWAGPKGDAMKAQIPTGRFAEPCEIAAAAVFLASEAAGMINGADLLIDGGFTVK
jgi:D-threitol dehydrogenase (NAD+)